MRVFQFLPPLHPRLRFHQLFALSALGGDDLAAVLVAGFFEVLVLAELLGEALLLAGLLETTQHLFQTLAGSAFYSNHKEPPFLLTFSMCRAPEPTGFH